MKRLNLLIAACACFATLYAAADPEKLDVQLRDNRWEVTVGEELFTAVNFKGSDKQYLYPIIGPTGANMTRHFPMKEGVAGESKDHPHHQSLWFAHGGVNGIDYWHTGNNAGTAELHSAGVNVREKTHSKLYTDGAWIDAKRNPVAKFVTNYRFELLDDGSRVIDCSTDINPAKGIDQLLFADTKEGTMAIRLTPQLRLKGEVATGKAINSNGDKDGKVWGKRAKWVAYWGEIDGKTCGVAIFDHPTNLRHPTWWHARDYGLVAANPFGISDFEKGKHKRGAGEYTVKQGEELKLRYRFVFFAGTAEEADIVGKYDQWVTDTMPKPEQEPIAD